MNSTKYKHCDNTFRLDETFAEVSKERTLACEMFLWGYIQRIRESDPLEVLSYEGTIKSAVTPVLAIRTHHRTPSSFLLHIQGLQILSHSPSNHRIFGFPTELLCQEGLPLCPTSVSLPSLLGLRIFFFFPCLFFLTLICQEVGSELRHLS